MNFHTRKWVKPEDLNPNGTLLVAACCAGSTKKPRFTPSSSWATSVW